ncbi:MAG: aminotransferase class V-fold PLP-dependent enzyme, partial [Spirosomaceae bacterium]|nr:aminotransferase class V-fold PLP-dependent enzyme [Spirosomataceae bacterium]
MNLKEYFEPFRKSIIGIDATFQTPYGQKPVIYADWTASGRLYAPIEQKLAYQFGELVGNTHSESTITGTAMTYAYHIAKDRIKEHVNASKNDVFLAIGSGMTGAVNKLQRILGLRIHEKYRKQVTLPEAQRPVVFITHLEHHSNQTSWLETIADVVVLDPDAEGLVDLQNLEENLEKYKNRPLKIGAFSSCSNVSGIYTPYHQMAKLMHRYGGWCFVDFAASAPYIDINMHPEDPEERLDAIYFSPHKFLGGPGSSGVLIFNSDLYQNKIPDNVGGGIVNWTNPWGGYSFVDDIENREDAGTPAFLQTIRSALCVELKDQMQVKNIHQRESDLLKIAFAELRKIQNL